MDVTTIVIALIGAAGLVTGGTLGWLGVRGRTRVDDRENYIAGLRTDLAGEREECQRQTARAEAFRLRLDIERAAWDARRLDYEARVNQYDYQAILLRRALERAGIPIPPGALDKPETPDP